jgi:hypothetical protein
MVLYDPKIKTYDGVTTSHDITSILRFYDNTEIYFSTYEILQMVTDMQKLQMQFRILLEIWLLTLP